MASFQVKVRRAFTLGHSDASSYNALRPTSDTKVEQLFYSSLRSVLPSSLIDSSNAHATD
jgi:hypothetical protein